MHITLTEAYKVLSVTADTSEADVKKAYKKLALRTHPDKNPNDPEASKKFLLVSEAYKRISDPSSFHDDEDDQMPDEEEMEAMFNMMFAEMMGGNGMGGISPEMFEAMEEMMMNGGDEDDVMAAMFGKSARGGMFADYDSDDSDDDGDDFGAGLGDAELLDILMQELMRPGKRGKSKSSKSSKFKADSKSTKSGKQRKGSYDEDEDEDSSDCWQTDEEEHDRKVNQHTLKNAKHKTRDESKDTEDDYGFPSSTSHTGKSVKFATSSGSRRVPPRVSSGFLSANGTSSKKKPTSTSKSSKTTTTTTTDSDGLNQADSKSSKSQHLGEWDAHKAEADKEAERDREERSRDSKAVRREELVVVGDRVLVQDRHLGKVAFVGTVHYTKGVYVGVIMDLASVGKNDGVIKGVEYFKCPNNSRGLMLPIADVIRFNA